MTDISAIGSKELKYADFTIDIHVHVFMESTATH